MLRISPYKFRAGDDYENGRAESYLSLASLSVSMPNSCLVVLILIREMRVHMRLQKRLANHCAAALRPPIAFGTMFKSLFFGIGNRGGLPKWFLAGTALEGAVRASKRCEYTQLPRRSVHLFVNCPVEGSAG